MSRLAQGISLHTLQNEMAMVRSILTEAGRAQLNQSVLISNKSLGISDATATDHSKCSLPAALARVMGFVLRKRRIVVSR